VSVIAVLRPGHAQRHGSSCIDGADIDHPHRLDRAARLPDGPRGLVRAPGYSWII